MIFNPNLMTDLGLSLVDGTECLLCSVVYYGVALFSHYSPIILPLFSHCSPLIPPLLAPYLHRDLIVTSS